MKKIISLMLTVFTVAIIFAAARPSLDGRAVVCEEGELPKGMFAKTIGYLPGDSVTVTNPANSTSVDVLILGSIDSSEGIAIMLSAEAAEKLAIKKDSSVQVKITRRTGSVDESVSGTAVLAGDGETSEQPEEPEAAENPVPETDSVTEGTFEEEISQENEGENPSLEEETPALEPEISENFEADLPEDGPETLTEDLTESVEPESFETVSETEPEETENFQEIAEGTEETEEESFTPEESFTETDTEVSAAEPVDADFFDSEAALTEEQPEADLFTDDSEFAGEEPAPEEAFEAKKLSEVQSEEEEPFKAENFAGFDEPENEVEAELETEPEKSLAVEEVIGSDEAEYAPIILSPAQPNPPEEQPEPVAEDEVSEPEVQEPEKQQVPEQKPSLQTAVEAETSPAAAYENFLTTEAELKKGMYYLQIATLSSEENLSNLVNKYGSKYPLAVIRLENKKAWRVLVGPLTADEFGMIKERFEAYGFKDAFLRKIK